MHNFVFVFLFSAYFWTLQSSRIWVQLQLHDSRWYYSILQWHWDLGCDLLFGSLPIDPQEFIACPSMKACSMLSAYSSCGSFCDSICLFSYVTGESGKEMMGSCCSSRIVCLGAYKIIWFCWGDIPHTGVRCAELLFISLVSSPFSYRGWTTL